MTPAEARAALVAQYEAFVAEMRADPSSLFSRLDRKLPKRKRVYYWFYRKLRQRNLWGRILNRIQRARRGYGDIDAFDLDDYLVSWLPQALRQMGSFGYPMRVIDHDGSLVYDSDGWEPPDNASDMWRQTPERMARGFEAQDVLAEYAGFGAEDAEAEIERIRDEGLQLFVRNLGALWD